MSDALGPERWLWQQLAALVPADELARLQAGFRERSRAAGRRSAANNRRRWLVGAEQRMRYAERSGDTASAARYKENAERHRGWLHKYGFSEEEHDHQTDYHNAE